MNGPLEAMTTQNLFSEADRTRYQEMLNQMRELSGKSSFSREMQGSNYTDPKQIKEREANARNTESYDRQWRQIVDELIKVGVLDGNFILTSKAKNSGLEK